VISKLRSEIFQLSNKAVVYNDSYNANPSSVTALFEAARDIRSNAASGLTRTVAVVGDMLELGPESPELHRRMGERAARDGVDVLLATGKFSADWVRGYNGAKAPAAPFAHDFPDHDGLWAALGAELKRNPAGALVLVKGSRGAKMDRIVDRLRASPLA
jgi:UDP-N-acetylmuramoyl-tripeptide--D-alanyl-D-alanine ligase